MTINQSITQKRSSRAFESGFTLIELLISMLLASLLITASIYLSIGIKKGMSKDQTRVNANQNVSGALDIISTDVRQAGENQTVPFSPISIIDNGAGNDTIQVRRQLSFTVMNICADVAAGATSVLVSLPTSDTTATGTSCSYSPAATGGTDPRPSNLAQWENLRLLGGANKKLLAFIYTPNATTGDFFYYRGFTVAGTNIPSSQRYSIIVSGIPSQYRFSAKPVMVLMEQKEYFRTGNDLIMRYNQDVTTDQKITPDVTGLSATITPISAPSTRLSSFMLNSNWKDVKTVNLDVSGNVSNGGEITSRTFSSQILPRNTFSR